MHVVVICLMTGIFGVAHDGWDHLPPAYEHVDMASRLYHGGVRRAPAGRTIAPVRFETAGFKHWGERRPTWWREVFGGAGCLRVARWHCRTEWHRLATSTATFASLVIGAR